MKAYNFCNNCGKSGHLFHSCKHPITSIGIIAFRPSIEGVQYLMIRRKDSLGFVDFMRGKYPLNNRTYIRTIIDEMTAAEKNKLLTYTFDELWKDLWGDFIGIQYRGEEKISRSKFESLKLGVEINNTEYNLEMLIKESDTNWKYTEWGFPKGRRNYQEKDLTCALREFEEETGYNKSLVKIIQNVLPYEEIFTGSNMKSYKHKYYIAYMGNKATDKTEGFQESEVSKMEWLSYDDCMNIIRPYNLEKKNVLEKVNNVLQEYRLYS